MKRTMRFIGFVMAMITILTVCTIPMSASAYSPYPNVYGGKLSGGLNGISYYYYDASAYDQDAITINQRIEASLNDWEWAINESAVMANSTLECQFTKASSAYYGTLEFQFIIEESLNNNEYIKLEYYNTEEGGLLEYSELTSSDWNACVFYIDKYNFCRLSAEKQRTAMCRAIGLALGLKINNTDNGVVMWHDIATSTATVPTQEDLRNIRYLYE